ncbi:hypothetical protein BDR03DRAFT_964225 [Suillus americanus]|nr:hypothetical protein BDR03DRAFT_964225 [Suillus americanus]
MYVWPLCMYRSIEHGGSMPSVRPLTSARLPFPSETPSLHDRMARKNVHPIASRRARSYLFFLLLSIVVIPRTEFHRTHSPDTSSA